VHGNASPALRVLGGTVASEWHGRGDVHGGARAVLVQGIDPLGRGRSGGAVTAQGVVGGVLSELGAHGGHGGILGGRGVAGSSHCEVGVSEGVCRGGDHPLGVGVGGGGRREG
jgi:hypothetical protein